jgi:hypothetical protein
MIISRWKGFEIDSSEAYFYFQNDMAEVEEGYDFMRRLLASPLIWKKVSFTIMPLKEHESKVTEFLQGKTEKGDIAKVEYYDDCIDEVLREIEEYRYDDKTDGHLPSHIDPLYETTAAAFLDIIDEMKGFTELISVNFSIVPLKSLPADEYEKFHSWYMDQYEDLEMGKIRWDDFCEVSGDDLPIHGICEHTDFYDRTFSLSGSFEFHNKPPFSYRYILTGHDASLTFYVLSQLLERFTISFGGCHGVSCDRSPDKWDRHSWYIQHNEEAQ